jgi:hypothetical protein
MEDDMFDFSQGGWLHPMWINYTPSWIYIPCSQWDRRHIACWRIQALKGIYAGRKPYQTTQGPCISLAEQWADELVQAIPEWFTEVENICHFSVGDKCVNGEPTGQLACDLTQASIKGLRETLRLFKVLEYIQTARRLDVVFAAEWAAAHKLPPLFTLLNKLLNFDIRYLFEYGFNGEHNPGRYVPRVRHDKVTLSDADDDMMLELQDKVFAIYNYNPCKFSFTREDLIQRLPCAFVMPVIRIKNHPRHLVNGSTITAEDDDLLAGDMDRVILVQQVTERQSAQEDVGFGTFDRCKD